MCITIFNSVHKYKLKSKGKKKRYATESQCWFWGVGAQSWNIHFGLALSDWELESVDLLFDTLYANIAREEGPDRFKLTEND